MDTRLRQFFIMRGLGCLRWLISARMNFTSQRMLHFVSACSQNRINTNILKTGNECGFLHIMLQKRLLSLQQLENKLLQNVLLSVGFTDEEIEGCIKADSELLKYPVHKLQNVAVALSQQGLTMKDIKLIFLQLPHIIQADVNRLTRTINKWRELRLKEEDLVRIFVKHPLYLLLTSEYIDSRLKNIVSLFTNSDVTVLIETMPSIFTDDWDNILTKVHYIQSYMGFTQIQMMRSCVLEHSLLHIKNRHMFISLSGVFKTHNPKKAILNNPSLKSIVDSTDKDFVKRCGLTLEEYYMFCDIVASEEMEDDIE